MDRPQHTITATADAEMYCPSCDRSYAGEERCPSDGTRLIALTSDDPLIGQDIAGCYTVKEFLGAGGMGTVYVAEQHSVGRDVALKVIQARGGAATKRFLREAKLQSRLTQPHVVTVLDFGKSGPHLFIAMELLEGPTLGDVLKRDGAMSPSRVVEIGVQLCEALQAAHELGIVHRDLKPGNVILTTQPSGGDFIKVLDFGLSKSLTGESQTTVTRTGQVLGTPAYMAPETIVDGVADARSDLYALGVTLYAMLAGRRPFQASQPQQMLAMQTEAQPDPLPGTVPPALSTLVMRLLAKEPDDRPQSAAEVLRALGGSLEAGTTPTSSRRRHVALLAAGAVVVASVTSLVVLRGAGGDSTEPANSAPASPPPSMTAASRPAPTDAGVPDAATADARIAEVAHTIESRPSALLFVDGKRVGTTPQTLTVGPGTRLSIRLTRRGYRAETTSILVDRPGTTSFTLSRVRRPRPGPRPPAPPPPGDGKPWLEHE